MARRGTRTSTRGGRRKVAVRLRQLPDASVALEDVGTHVELLVRELGTMIDAARKRVSATANAALVLLYWQIGQRVHKDVREGRRAEYGAQIVSAAGRQLEATHGRGFGEKSLRRMIQFVSAFPSPEIVATLSRQLGWSHFIESFPFRTRSCGNSMSRCAGWKAGACAPYAHASTACFSNARLFRRSRRRS